MLLISFSKMGIATEIPRQESGEITASIEKRHTEAAFDLVTQIQLELVEHKLKDTEAWFNHM